MNKLEELEEILTPLYKFVDSRKLEAIDGIKELFMRLKKENTSLKEAIAMACLQVNS